MKKKRVPHVSQLIQTECGLCCISMILRYYDNYTPLNEIRKYLQPGRDGTSVKELHELLKQFNFDTRVYSGSLDSITSLDSPVIVYWEKRHFVVLEKIKKHYYYIVDPALGRVRLSQQEFKEKFSDMIITSEPNKDFIKVKKEKNIWLHYLKILSTKKKTLCNIGVMSLFSYAFTLAFPLLIQFVIDHASKINISIKIFSGFLLAIISYLLVVFINGRIQVKFKNGVFSDFCKDVIKHLTNLPYTFFEVRSFGDISFSIESINIIKNLYSEKLVGFFIDLGAVFVMVTYLMCISPLIALVVLITLISIGIILKLLSNMILFSNQLEINSMAKLQSIQLELIYSMLNIKIAGIEDKIYNSWDKQFDTTLDKTIKRDYYQNYYNTISEMCRTLSPLLILFLGLDMYLKHKFSLGQIMSIYSIANMIFAYAINIFTSINYFSLSSQYLERVKDITDQEVEKNGSKQLENSMNSKIVLKDVSFSYTKTSSNVLKNISLDIEYGKKIGIVGSSGSGKSTLSKLILGLYEPTEGSVYYNGVNLNEIDKKQLRKVMGIVPQDTSLFNKSIFENITMGRDDLSLDDVKEACKIAQIYDEIESMPMKYNTLVSDMGMNLSGGQRQRIILARALVSKPKIILFDEATSSLDSINEKHISNYLNSYGCTRIVIAHRLSTIKDADIIYVMKDGELIEMGNHEDLMKAKGRYKELYDCQVGGQQLKVV